MPIKLRDSKIVSAAENHDFGGFYTGFGHFWPLLGDVGQFFTGFGGQNFSSVQLGATVTLFKSQVRVCASEEVEKLIKQTKIAVFITLFYLLNPQF